MTIDEADAQTDGCATR